MNEANRIINALRDKGHAIGAPYFYETKERTLRLFLVIDDVAMTVSQAARLESGQATIAEIAAEIDRLNAGPNRA